MADFTFILYKSNNEYVVYHSVSVLKLMLHKMKESGTDKFLFYFFLWLIAILICYTFK